MPRRNRVDPLGDLHAVSAQGMFTGNRGCLVDDDGRLVRHHNGQLWITCRTRYRNWRHPLDAPRTWTPLFFLDDAVALAAGHRPCGLCRRSDYLAYRASVTTALQADGPVLATQLNRRLSAERHRRGRGLSRSADRLLWSAPYGTLPPGTVIIGPGGDVPHLVTPNDLRPFAFTGWGMPVRSSLGVGETDDVMVVTPPTSVAALRHGYRPQLDSSAVGNARPADTC